MSQALDPGQRRVGVEDAARHVPIGERVVCQNSADAKQRGVVASARSEKLAPPPQTARMRPVHPYLWQFLALTFAGWVNRSQQDAIEYLLRPEARLLSRSWRLASIAFVKC